MTADGTVVGAGAPAVREGQPWTSQLLLPAMRVAERQAAVVAGAAAAAGAITRSAVDGAKGLGRLEAVAGPQPLELTPLAPGERCACAGHAAVVFVRQHAEPAYTEQHMKAEVRRWLCLRTGRGLRSRRTARSSTPRCRRRTRRTAMGTQAPRQHQPHIRRCRALALSASQAHGCPSSILQPRVLRDYPG